MQGGYIGICSSTVDAHVTAFGLERGLWSDPAVQVLQGLPGVSLQWGAWGGSGMAAEEGPLLSRLARLGMGAIQPVQGLHTLQTVVQGTARMAVPPMEI